MKNNIPDFFYPIEMPRYFVVFCFTFFVLISEYNLSLRSSTYSQALNTSASTVFMLYTYTVQKVICSGGVML